ncbi:MAG: hypothetical protein MHM6MM_003674 [Cercozoa sp. M6MM]
MGGRNYERWHKSRNALCLALAFGVMAGLGVLLTLSYNSTDYSHTRGPGVIETSLAYSSLFIHRSRQMAVTAAGVLDPSNTSLNLLAEREGMPQGQLPSTVWRRIDSDEIAPLVEVLTGVDTRKLEPNTYTSFKQRYWAYSQQQREHELRVIDTYEALISTNASEGSVQAAEIMAVPVNDESYWDANILLQFVDLMTHANEADLEAYMDDVGQRRYEIILVGAITACLTFLLIALVGFVVANEKDEGSRERLNRLRARAFTSVFLFCATMSLLIGTVSPIASEPRLREFRNALAHASTSAILLSNVNLLWSLCASMALAPNGLYAINMSTFAHMAKMAFRIKYLEIPSPSDSVNSIVNRLLADVQALQDVVPVDENQFNRTQSERLFRATIEARAFETYSTVMSLHQEAVNNAHVVVNDDVRTRLCLRWYPIGFDLLLLEFFD